MRDLEALTARGQRYYARGFFEAASDTWERGLCLNPGPRLATLMCDGRGKVAAQRGRPEEALRHFQSALDKVPIHDHELGATLHMHRALALAQMGHRDQAYRELSQLVRDQHQELSAVVTGVLWTNLAALQIDNGLYHEAVSSLQEASSRCDGSFMERHGYAVKTNLGQSYLEMGEIPSAREAFAEALALAPGPPIHAVNGLAQVAALDGKLEDIERWGRRAMEGMWQSLIGFEIEELAHLSAILGHMALKMGYGRLASRYLDHAQSLYGRLGLWSRWRGLNTLMAEAERLPHKAVIDSMAEELLRFLVLMESMLAQDLVDPKASELADIRNSIAVALTEGMGWPIEQQEGLTYVCRLADLGLSVVDLDASRDPERAPLAQSLYERHPEMSTKLLDRLGLSAEILEGIRDHHERFDGGGYPEEKSGQEIAPWARLYAVADAYAVKVVAGCPHLRALGEISDEASRAYDPGIVEVLLGMFAE